MFWGSVFAFQRQSVLLLSFHRHSYRNRNWVNDWLYDFGPNHMARFNLSRLRNRIFASRWLSFLPHILAVLPLSLWRLIFISAMISRNVLRNLYPSLLSPSLTFFCMFGKLAYHNKFLTNCAWLGPTTAGFFVFLNFDKSISVLAELTIDRLSGTSFRMRLKHVGSKHLLAHFTLFLRMFLCLDKENVTSWVYCSLMSIILSHLGHFLMFLKQ